jgi:hypothetical protein
VDQEDELYGHVNGWSTHLLVATGKTDWVRDVADEEGSVMEAIDRGGVLPGNGVSNRDSPKLDMLHTYVQRCGEANTGTLCCLAVPVRN